MDIDGHLLYGRDFLYNLVWVGDLTCFGCCRETLDHVRETGATTLDLGLCCKLHYAYLYIYWNPLKRFDITCRITHASGEYMFWTT